MPVEGPARGQKTFDKLAKFCGCYGMPDALACLRRVPYERFLAATSKFFMSMWGKFILTMLWAHLLPAPRFSTGCTFVRGTIIILCAQNGWQVSHAASLRRIFKQPVRQDPAHFRQPIRRESLFLPQLIKRLMVSNHRRELF